MSTPVQHSILSGMELKFFTIYYGDSDPILSHTKSWVESIARHFVHTTVYATHVENNGNQSDEFIAVKELGGGNFFKRFLAVIKLMGITAKMWSSRKNMVCFFHMSAHVSAVIAPFLKIMGINSFIWYSHQAKSLALRMTVPFINLIFTPSEGTFPISSDKIRVVGHGLVPLREFETITNDASRDNSSVIVIGRIAPVKRIENLVLALANSGFPSMRIECVGPLQDLQYVEFLRELSQELKVSLVLKGPLSRNDLNLYLAKKGIVYSGTEKSVDKAPLEAVALGCVVITANEEVQKLSYISDFWQKEMGERAKDLSIESQIRLLKEKKISKTARRQLSRNCLERNDLEALMHRIKLEMIRCI